jgi:2-polyprenyl-6-hydroxyphenyl methylase / 3-demethylubiquinone-9 3-methyltransferase
MNMHKNTSIDLNEMEKFNKTSSEWWDFNGEFKVLHKISPVRLSYITSKIKQHFSINEKSFSTINILDVGCGGGLITLPLAQIGANMTGIDANKGNIFAATSYAEKHNIKINYIHSTAEELASKDIQYDVILCLEVIEHIANPHDFIKNLIKLTKAKGMLIISTINRNIKSYLLAIMMAEYVLKWTPAGTHDYRKFIKPSELYEMLNSNKAILKELKGLTFDVISQNWQLSTNIDVNYFAYCVISE